MAATGHTRMPMTMAAIAMTTTHVNHALRYQGRADGIDGGTHDARSRRSYSP